MSTPPRPVPATDPSRGPTRWSSALGCDIHHRMLHDTTLEELLACLKHLRNSTANAAPFVSRLAFTGARLRPYSRVTFRYEPKRHGSSKEKDELSVPSTLFQRIDSGCTREY